jgi:Amt family ammonium transporter
MRLRTFRRGVLAVPAVLLLAVLLVSLATPVHAQQPPDQASPAGPDPAGTSTGAPENLAGVTVSGGKLTTDDIKAAKEKEPFAYNLAAYVDQNRLAINIVWVLITGYLVMFMQAGFALVETGFCRVKSAMHVMMTNFMIYGLGMLAYWAVGFAFQFGGIAGVRDGWSGGPTNLNGLSVLDRELTLNGWGIIGLKGFFLNPSVLDVSVAAMFLFQMVFMDTAATILTGAAAERWKWTGFLAWGIFVGAILYPVFGNWAWGGGWLAQLSASGLGRSYLDFAGSGVVHAVGGWAGLAAAVVLGARIGKYNRDGSPNPMPGHNLVMAALGCFILAFGWFGFNPGSTLGASGSGNLRIAVIATVTMLAGAAASISAMAYARATLGKWDPGYMMNGLLAGLVAITAPSGYVSPISAVIIGAVAGVLVCMSMAFIERVLKVDDPVGAISVHGTCGAFGQLALGLFADGTANYGGATAKGLFFGDWRQFVAQLIGMVVVFMWAFGASLVFFKLLNALGLLRAKPEDELAGLDVPEMGTPAYPLEPPVPQGAGVLYPGGGFRPAPALGSA